MPKHYRLPINPPRISADAYDEDTRAGWREEVQRYIRDQDLDRERAIFRERGEDFTSFGMGTQYTTSADPGGKGTHKSGDELQNLIELVGTLIKEREKHPLQRIVEALGGEPGKDRIAVSPTLVPTIADAFGCSVDDVTEWGKSGTVSEFLPDDTMIFVKDAMKLFEYPVAEEEHESDYLWITGFDWRPPGS